MLGEIEWDSTTRSGTLSAYSPGRVTVAEEIYHSNGTLKSTVYFEFSIVPQVGTYYIRNVKSEKYVEADTSTTEGMLVHQWDFNTSNQEKWIIEYVPNSGGYIRFKSIYSNLYLGMDPSDITVVKQYTANNYTSWRIDRTASGNYILINKATGSSNNVLSVPLGTTTNGTNLTQLTYTNDMKYNDEWELYVSSPYTVNLEVIYNQAYNTRYANASTRISNELAALQEKFMIEFGITVLHSSPAIFSSYADVECTASYDELCTCAPEESCRNSSSGSLETYYHKNIYNIRERISSPDTTASLKIVYIGHEICRINRQNKHEEKSIVGLAYRYEGVAMIMNFDEQKKKSKH